ncbi:LytTR family DNA-binding domain-containing protein [Pedobacter sp. MC2016-24]|uniref:LytR/AlgR family response regulator transcription factor n=1 Tax=Pedobacter sp. MC2016-24 TaxID=2780090 RepID=UPI00187FD6F8|nr:LytTR family DNA-binding domain-containing protein [Pedobacter sp. MC2016-24]MBE9600151.1 response regulator transcription factor [Pedobacter sp. MC2016-24]
MKIVIIEDEKLTAEDLADVIVKLQPDVQLMASLSSVKEGLEYFKHNPAPDLIFSDIQLGDGLSFDIFKSVNITAPIIFCTAYNEYALNAFRTTGIDYILKPVTALAVAQAINKYHTLRKGFAAEPVSYDAIFELFTQKKTQVTTSILVNYKDRIIPVKTEQIALFYIQFEETNLLSFDGKNYVINKKMEELERSCGDDFFRVNRQVLLNRKAIKDAAHFFSRKMVINLNIPFKETITISKEKTTPFLDWLANK